MDGEGKVTIKKERSVHTYITMWWASGQFLENGLQEAKGSKNQYMASLVFTAFALEAYLNHIGTKLYKSWGALERPLGPRQKLNLVAERLGIIIHYGERPWEVMGQLFGFRNDIAHGKSVVLEESKVVPLSEFSDEHAFEFIKTKWERYCTKENAMRAREDVQNIMETMHKAARFEDNPYPFVGGMQLGSATVSDK